jgi:GNAT superfamily N-acetyltransferase
MRTVVRDLNPGDEAEFLRLWNEYLAFYQRSDLPSQTTAHTWARILDPGSPVFARVAVHDGGLAGFAICVLHEGTWVTAPICYLEDLYVDEGVRGGGVGKALIDDVMALGRERGWARVYWHTEADNHRARRLYDRYKDDDGYVRYTLRLDEEPPRR